jgi:pimeloyl-ACP methyl ester carboxylesterase
MLSILPMFKRALVSARLIYWLGPFGPEDKVPSGLRERTLQIEGIDVLEYEPQGRVYGQVMTVPGLHPAGPRDPRMQQFCRRLAGGGLRVFAPALPEYLALRLDASVITSLQKVARGLPGRFALFSISWGSLPALRLIASDPDRVQGLVVFGGYADFAATMRFALGDGTSERDPLNPPVIFINLGAEVAGAPKYIAAVVSAWHTFAVRTWGQPQMRELARYSAVADELSAPLTAEQRELFYLGCGLRPGMLEKAQAALDRIVPLYGHLDPRPYLKDVRVPVTIVHGADDDVIPFQEADKLAALLPSSKRYITGLYGHTGAKKPSPLQLASEALKLAAMVDALAVYVTSRSA